MEKNALEFLNELSNFYKDYLKSIYQNIDFSELISNPDEFNHEQKPLFHIAIEKCDLNLIKSYLFSGVTRNIRNRGDKTPLMIAIRTNSLEILFCFAGKRKSRKMQSKTSKNARYY